MHFFNKHATTSYKLGNKSKDPFRCYFLFPFLNQDLQFIGLRNFLYTLDGITKTVTHERSSAGEDVAKHCPRTLGLRCPAVVAVVSNSDYCSCPDVRTAVSHERRPQSEWCSLSALYHYNVSLAAIVQYWLISSFLSLELSDRVRNLLTRLSQEECRNLPIDLQRVLSLQTTKM